VEEQQEATLIEEAEVGRQQYAQQFGCPGCHSTDGCTLVGPTFQEPFGSRRNFKDGTAVPDEEYIRNVIKGFTDVMLKNYQDQLTEELGGLSQPARR
jgi:cytochrome c551/c552